MAATSTSASQPKVNLGEKKVSAWFPSVVVNGRTLKCPHTRYGHESVKAAEKCSRSLIAQAPKPQPKPAQPKQPQQPKPEGAPKAA
jgi:hypothetical protein